MLNRFQDKKVDREWLNSNFPCMMACPAGTNAGRYVALIAEGRFEEAYRYARDPNPMASVCGRVCAHPCETACRRGAIDNQETLGEKLNETHCVRCRDSESTPARVSNQGNLEAKPHSFTDGAVLNSMSDAILVAIISHGDAALNKSAEMPPYGNTLNKAEIDALVAFLRAVADPPYRPGGVFYAGN